MATNLGRLFSSTLVKSDFSNSTSRRLICNTTQLFTHHQKKKESSVLEINEKTQNQIEDEQKFSQPTKFGLNLVRRFKMRPSRSQVRGHDHPSPSDFALVENMYYD
ncbi:hypothetical protein Fot_13268 [Forsythia ovata]|uniref:Uncharacterized protein n=1 Tax=Forsythia ovata TaxID=205694 RepID=A0ABD1W2Z7_9LAMI